jgi:hypothetical protein
MLKWEKRILHTLLHALGMPIKPPPEGEAYNPDVSTIKAAIRCLSACADHFPYSKGAAEHLIRAMDKVGERMMMMMMMMMIMMLTMMMVMVMVTMTVTIMMSMMMMMIMVVMRSPVCPSHRSWRRSPRLSLPGPLASLVRVMTATSSGARRDRSTPIARWCGHTATSSPRGCPSWWRCARRRLSRRIVRGTRPRGLTSALAARLVSGRRGWDEGLWIIIIIIIILIINDSVDGHVLTSSWCHEPQKMGDC